MRRLIPLFSLAVAACASTPTAPVSKPLPAAPGETGDLIGLTANDLGQRFGQPQFQVREGVGTKLQFRTQACVLDAYLYPPEQGSGMARVAHVDTRNRAGRDVDQAGCIAALIAR